METTKLKPFTITAADARRWFLKGQRGNLQGLICATIVFLVAGVLVRGGDRAMGQLCLVIGFFSAAFVIGVTCYKLRRINSPKNRLLFEERLVSFDDEQLSMEMPSSTSSIRFDRLIEAKENEEVFSLYIAQAYWVTLPKAAFESDADQIRLRDILQRHKLLA